MKFYFTKENIFKVNRCDKIKYRVNLRPDLDNPNAGNILQVDITLKFSNKTITISDGVSQVNKELSGDQIADIANDLLFFMRRSPSGSLSF